MANATSPDPYANIRSKNSMVQSSIVFFNRTKQPLDLYWVDYHGKHIRYTTIEPNEPYDVGSFVTHPWIFRDNHTGDKLVTLPNREYVYYPKKNLPSGIPRAVIISDPILTLREQCSRTCLKMVEGNQQLADHFTSALPSTLQAELMQAVESAADYRAERLDLMQ